MIQGAAYLNENPNDKEMKVWEGCSSRTKWKVIIKTSSGCFKNYLMAELTGNAPVYTLLP